MASLAVLKACSSCGERDLNWAMWQFFAPGGTLVVVGTGSAQVLVSTTARSIRGSPKILVMSVTEGQRVRAGAGAVESSLS